ncbi:PDXK-like protein [Mya arenaria]|uniref:Pyridoxal kinase n=1 Tax=Mya arenaria TaxID=6604 RepID=A0ABY7EH90_MYAAR|nr:PDXK-like protein [Mya arenaria]
MSSIKQNHVLSIQSTVVCGYVGNKCASFALQVHGFDFSPINSVQLSNHTGYKFIKGQVLDADDVDCLYEGLKQNNIHNQFSHLLTVCDPVMGDNGKLYVPEDLLPVYKDVIIPKADIVTPNQFEAELLTDMKISNEADALLAMQRLLDKGPRTVVLSSTNLGSNGKLVALACSVKKVAGSETPTPAQMELRLMQSKADIENPKINFTAQKIS